MLRFCKYRSTEDDFDLALREVESDMKYRLVRSGVVVLSQPLASGNLGPVPRALICQGISLHCSTSSDVHVGAARFVEDFVQARDATQVG